MNVADSTVVGAAVWLIVSVMGVIYHFTQVNLMKAQLIESVGNTLKEKQEARRRWDAACSNAKVPLRALTPLFHLHLDGKLTGEDRQKLIDARSDFCDSLSTHVVPEFVAWAEWMHLDIRNGDKATRAEKLLDAVETVVFAELDRILKWRGIINRDEFCKELKLAPLVFSRAVFTDLLKLADGLSVEKQQQTMRILREKFEALCAAPSV